MKENSKLLTPYSSLVSSACPELEQPEGSYRYSEDALLLAAFAVEQGLATGSVVADLGCGCGVVGLQAGRLVPGIRVIGLDINPSLTEAAMRNAAAWGVGNYTAITGNVADTACLKHLRQLAVCYPKEDTCRTGEKGKGQGAPHFDAVLCNPPWMLWGKGRLSPSASRNTALFGDTETLAYFFQAADTLVRAGGSCFISCGSSRLQDALAALPPRLTPVALRFVHGRTECDSAFFLLHAVKGSKATLRILPPLYIIL